MILRKLGIVSKFRFKYLVNLRELINFNPPEILKKPRFCDDLRRNRI